MEIPASQSPRVVSLRRTAVDAVAHFGGEKPLALRSPAPLDASDTFFLEPQTDPIQMVVQPTEVTGPGATMTIRIEGLTPSAEPASAVMQARRELTRAYTLYQAQVRLEEDAAAAPLAALDRKSAAPRSPERPPPANWQIVDSSLAKASDELSGCSDASPLAAEILAARAALATLKLESWEAAMQLSREADTRARALGQAATSTRMQILQASALIDGATEAKRSNEAARQDEALRTFTQAASLLQTARSSYRRSGRLADEAYVENYLGAANHYAGSWDEARRHYEAADSLYARTPPSFRRAVVKQNMALLANDSGDYADAAQLFEQAATMIRGAPQPDMLATILENRGSTLSTLGRQDEAIAAYSGALSIRRGQADQPGLARATLGTGLALMRTGDTRAAMPFIEQAWTIRTANRDRDRRGWLASGLARAELLRMDGDTAGALQTLEQIQPVAISPVQRARFAVQRAKILADVADPAGALAEYEAVLKLDLPQIHPNVTFARIGRLRSLLELHRLDAARAQFATDRALIDVLPGSLPAIEAQFLSAELEVRLGRRDLGLAAVEKAIAATRRIRSGSLSAESRARFIASRREQDELRICLFAGCAALPQAPRDAVASLLASEDARAGMLAELIAAATSRRQYGAHDDAARGQLLSEIDARLARVDALSDRPIANARELEALRRSMLDAQTRLSRLDAPQRIEPGRQLSRSQLEQLLARLPAQTTVLEYFLGRRTLLVWKATRDGVTVHEVASGTAEIAALRDDIRSLAQASAGDPTLPQRLTRLGRLLVEPYVDGSARHLVVVPDGELSFVPFAALSIMDPLQLVDRSEVILTPSLMRLSIGETHTPTLDTAAIVADPVFDADDPRVPDSVSVQVAAGGGAERFARLPATTGEARSVQALLGNRQATVLIGTAATRDNVLKTFGQGVAIAHFASHAVIRASDPSLSFLALSAYDEGWRRVPARLYSSEIVAAGIRADLVVLSACRSALGDVIAGEGPLGLSYSFLANGSGAVVAATWPVPDTFSAEFMRDFYTALAREPGSPAAALRTAQLQARRSLLWNDPYYWAAFSLTTLRL